MDARQPMDRGLVLGGCGQVARGVVQAPWAAPFVRRTQRITTPSRRQHFSRGGRTHDVYASFAGSGVSVLVSKGGGALSAELGGALGVVDALGPGMRAA